MNRILHINSTIVINSGVMRVLMNYYAHINTDVIQFDFLYFSELKNDSITFKDEIQNKGGRVYNIPDFANLKKFNKELKALLVANNYTIVHIHDAIVCRFIYKTLRECGVKHIIVHSHATKWSDKKINGVRNYLICRNLDKYIDDKFACSIAAGKFMYGEEANCFIVNNAIDTQKYCFKPNIREVLRVQYNFENKVVFGHVGNFVNQKNHVYLMKIYKEILKLHPESILLLVGDGPLRKSIEEIAADPDYHNSVLFLGKRDNVEDYYQAMDCFLLPSLYEGLPMVGVEAQCSGLPVLFSDTITREVGIVDSQFLSIKTNPKEWAIEAISLVDSLSDKDRILAAKHVSYKGFDIKEESRKLEEKYLSMM